jgi:tetratricopeptide (TPR) repeat protein
LLKQERRALHQVVGSAIEELYPERVGELAAVLAVHFEQAGDADRAIRYLSDAARFAADRNAIVEAYDLYRRAADLLPERSDDEGDDVRRRRLQIQIGRARAGFTFTQEGQGLAILEPLIPDARALGDLQLEADLHLTISLLQQFRGVSPEEDERLRSSLQRVAEIADELDDPFIAALPESIIGLFRVFTGDLRGGVALLEKTAPQLEHKHDFVGSSFALMALGLGYGRLGEFDRAEEVMAKARELGAKGDIIARIDTLIGTSWLASIRGDFEAGMPLARQCTTMAEEAGASACMVASNFILGDMLVRKGQYGEAKIALDRSSEVANAIQQRQFRPTVAALALLNAEHLGGGSPGELSFDQAIEEARSIGDRWAEASIIWNRAQVEARKGDGADVNQMLVDFTDAAGQYEAMGARPYQARVLRDWGNALRALGRAEEGDSRLRESLELLDALGIKHEADELREALAA